MFSLRSKPAFYSVALLFVILLTSCASSSLPSNGTYPIDAVFTDFFREFGGQQVLGSPISPVFIKDGVSYQYVVSAILSYDPNQAPLERYKLSSIAASEWQINGLVQPIPEDQSDYYVNGHLIWEELRSFYDQFGCDILGLPLTGVVVNEAKQRYEQYFDGIGFYRNFTDPVGQVHLMPYGAWECGKNCRYRAADSLLPAASYARSFTATEQVFLQVSGDRGYGFTGAPLSPPSLGSDGNYQMVFENVVMYIDSQDGNQIKLRPLPVWLGIRSDKPVMPVNSVGLTFIETGKGLGYNVPDIFVEYIHQHGTMNVAGLPITEINTLSDGGYSQCFTAVCLEYHPTAPEQLRVRPHMLGNEYLAVGSKATTPAANAQNVMQINAWEERPLIPSGENQVIHIQAVQNDIPMKGINFSLIVTKPDGITLTYSVEPTGTDGNTSITLDPINGPNGAIINYQVCMIGSASPQVCFSRSYTIWDQ
jgi:hypothetical protein